MSAIKAYYEDYCTSFDNAWEALTESISLLKGLNDIVYTEEGAIRNHVSAADVATLRTKIKEVTLELSCFAGAVEPTNLSPILPGELRLV